MYNLHDKMVKLKRLDDVVMFRWVAGHKRIAGDYVLLSNMRLNVLSCDHGKVVYSSSAPIMYQFGTFTE